MLNASCTDRPITLTATRKRSTHAPHRHLGLEHGHDSRAAHELPHVHIQHDVDRPGVGSHGWGNQQGNDLWIGSIERPWRPVRPKGRNNGGFVWLRFVGLRFVGRVGG